ncbi:MAG TPA: hypothetical protein VFC78_20375 [Tepidisphaeraceae bacterium]|nr:hypothetical protein [Tepidisphaeraceae bacterium]
MQTLNTSENKNFLEALAAAMQPAKCLFLKAFHHFITKLPSTCRKIKQKFLHCAPPGSSDFGKTVKPDKPRLGTIAGGVPEFPGSRNR